MVDGVERCRHVQQQRDNAFLIVYFKENVILHLQRNSLCAVKAGIYADWSDMLTMLVKMGRRVDLHSLRIDAGIGSRSQDLLPILSTKRSTSLADITLNFVIH